MLKTIPIRRLWPALLLCAGLLAAPLHARALSTTTLSASSSSLAHGTALTLTAAVGTGLTAPPTGIAVTAGTVKFCDTTTVTTCIDSGLLGKAQLLSTGYATYKFIPSIGTHTYKAIFVGSGGLNTTSTSGSVTVTVTGTYPTQTVLTSSGSAGNYTLNATVSNYGSLSAGPTGSVSFADATNANFALGSANLGGSTVAQSWLLTSSSAASVPRYIAVGDFNGDGIPDFAVALQNSAQVAIYLGVGDGTYVPATGSPVAVGNTPVGVVAADMNGDGKLDLMVTNNASGTVSILLGNGDGTFQTATTVSVPSPTVLRAVDLNNDGKLDLAVCSQSTNTVRIFLGNGDGTFAAGTSVAVGATPYGIAIGDLNGDGNQDLIIANKGGNTITVLLGAGNGTFTQATGSPITVGANPGTLALADFNGDGFLDLVVGNTGDSTLSVLLGHGDGTFATPTSLATQGNSDKHLVALDINRDGKMDITVAEFGGTLSSYMGNGDGTFQTASVMVSGATSLSSLAVLDSDGDGFPDFLVASQGSNKVFNSNNRYAHTAVATLSPVSIPGGGTHSIKATYASDGTSAGSVSGNLSLTATPSPTSVTLTAAPGSSTYTQQVALTATLAPYLVGAETNNGETITFKNGATTLGTAVLSSGVATLQVTSLPVGSDPLTAVYAADTNFASSTSAINYYSVSKAMPTVSWTAPASITYGTALSSTQLNATASVAGSFVYTPASGAVLNVGNQTLAVAFTPTDTTDYTTASGSTSLMVTQASGMVLLSAATNPIPRGSAEVFTATVSNAGTGSVTFKDGATTLGTAAISGGVATFSTSALTLGSHNITAVWSGDTNYTAAISSALAVTVQKGGINIVGSSTLNPSIFGDSITLTWACSGNYGTPTGTLTLKDGATTLSTLTLDANGNGSYTFSTLTATTHTLTVTYSGDSNYI